MNQNYIAPEALDENARGTCLACKRFSMTFEEKLLFYQGQCPHCGSNPSAMPVAKKSEAWDLSTPAYVPRFNNAFIFHTQRRSNISFEELPGTLEPNNEGQNPSASGND